MLGMFHGSIPEFLPSFYCGVCLDCDEKILPSVGNEVIDVIGGFRESCCSI